jgi:hypothetical protein
MTTIQMTRLRILARALRTQIKPEQFNISFWVSGQRQNAKAVKRVYARQCNGNLSLCCADAACAAGWAALIPALKKDGLYMDYGSPAYNGERGYAALQKFFGLTWRESIKLFGADNPNGAVAAAIRIKKLLKGKRT